MEQITSWLGKPGFGQIPNGVWLIDCVLQLSGIALALSGLIIGFQQSATPAGISNATWWLITLGGAIIALGGLIVAILCSHYRSKKEKP